MMYVMRKLPPEKRAAILDCLAEGSSISSTARCCGVSPVSVLRLLADAGSLAAEYHDLMVRRLQTQRVEADEVWSFVGCKAKAKSRGAQGHGDAWIWIALDADSKLVISYRVGDRDSENANAIMKDLAGRVENRIQLSTDALSAYPGAVEAAFGGNVDYAQIHKVYQSDPEMEGRYSPAKCSRVVRKVIQGTPDPDLISTSYVERQNLSVRMSVRRLTRLTNAFSKALENHKHAIALHILAYNFMRKHKTLKTTPAVAAGIAERPMTMLDFVAILEKEERIRGSRLTGYLPAAVSSK